jgi:C_GCAxxG_C_C family probable redox protein
MTIREIFLEKDHNCAETVLLWANERYGLNVAPEDVSLVSGFGGGLGCGENCGALLGALAVLGKIRVASRAHATVGFNEECARLVDLFRTDLGSIECAELKELYRRPDVRCLYVVERAAAVLDAYLKELEGTLRKP